MWKSSLRSRLAPIAVLAAVLAGCAVPGPSAVGADPATVLDRYGTPRERHPLAGGGERWFYPVGTLQQQVWAVDIDASGRVARVTQVRTAENFARVRLGIDTEADIRREFGPPRTTEFYSRVGLVGWMFPYVENLVWNSEMVIYVDPQGIVRRIENGPDPRFLGGSDRH